MGSWQNKWQENEQWSGVMGIKGSRTITLRTLQGQCGFRAEKVMIFMGRIMVGHGDHCTAGCWKGMIWVGGWNHWTCQENAIWLVNEISCFFSFSVCVRIWFGWWFGDVWGGVGVLNEIMERAIWKLCVRLFDFSTRWGLDLWIKLWKLS